MIHVLDFNDKIIDFLSTDDPSLVRAIHKRNVNDNSEMLELLYHQKELKSSVNDIVLL